MTIAALTGCFTFFCLFFRCTMTNAQHSGYDSPVLANLAACSNVRFNLCESDNFRLLPVSYGVFLGLNPEDIVRLSGYDLVVIDAAYYTSEQIEAMHDTRQMVYTYLNIGAVESFRDYYEEYEPFILGVYEDWPDERWVDVSKPEWQEFIVKKLTFRWPPITWTASSWIMLTCIMYTHVRKFIKD